MRYLLSVVLIVAASGPISAQIAVPQPSDAVFGDWKGNVYENNFTMPIRIELPRTWEEAIPPGRGLFALDVNNMIAQNPAAQLPFKDLKKAFIFWAEERRFDGGLTTLGMEFYGIKPGQSFDAAVDEQIKITLDGDKRRPGLLNPPLLTKTAIWIQGRRCWQFDFDGFYATGGLYKRYYYLPSKRATVGLAFAFTDPTKRASLDDLAQRMFLFGPEFTTGRDEQMEAVQISRKLSEAELSLRKQPEFQRIQSDLTKEVDSYALTVGRVQDFLNGIGGGGVGGIAEGFGRRAGANTALRHAAAYQTKIDALIADREKLRLKFIWSALDEPSQRQAANHYPEFAARATNKKVWTRYTPNSAAFVVNFPTDPQPSETRDEEKAESIWEGEEYRVVRKQLPEFVAKHLGNLEDVVKVVAEMTTAANAGALTEQRDVKISGKSAKEINFALKQNGQTQRLTMRVLLDAGNLYMVSTRLPGEPTPGQVEDSQKFLNSFELKSPAN